MNIFETTTLAVIKRPFIILLIGGLMLAAAIVNAFLPVVAMVIGIINLTGGSVFDGILYILQTLIDPDVFPTALLLLALVALFVSIAVGLLLSGYLPVVGDSIAQGEKKRGLFLKGLKLNFFRFFLITLRVVLFTAVLVLFLMVASVPAIVVTKAAFSTRPNLMIAAIFIDIVTVGVLFMSLSFFKAYVYMWYMAASNSLPKPFKAGKSIADRNFWGLAFSLLAFDVVFAAALFTIYLSDNQIFRYAAGWVFTTGFFTILAVYLAKYFRENTRNAPDPGNILKPGDRPGDKPGDGTTGKMII